MIPNSHRTTTSMITRVHRKSTAAIQTLANSAFRLPLLELIFQTDHIAAPELYEVNECCICLQPICRSSIAVALFVGNTHWQWCSSLRTGSVTQTAVHRGSTKAAFKQWNLNPLAKLALSPDEDSIPTPLNKPCIVHQNLRISHIYPLPIISCMANGCQSALV